MIENHIPIILTDWDVECSKGTRTDFPYMSMKSAKIATIFNTKQLFFVQLNQDRTNLKQYCTKVVTYYVIK